MKFAILVEIDVPDTTHRVRNLGSVFPDEHAIGYAPGRRDAVDYVRDAVQSWGGQRHPTDPFFKPTRVIVR